MAPPGKHGEPKEGWWPNGVASSTFGRIPAEGESLSTHGNARPDYKIDHETGCWEWQKGKLRGYGKSTFKGFKSVWAHRVYWMVANGCDVPDDHDIHHRCENPGCINPDHLEAVPKAHHVREHKRELVALTDQQRAAIRRAGLEPNLTQDEIAERFGIPRPTVNKILNGYSWFDGLRVLPVRSCRGCSLAFVGRNRKQMYCLTCRPKEAA